MIYNWGIKSISKTLLYALKYLESPPRFFCVFYTDKISAECIIQPFLHEQDAMQGQFLCGIQLI